MITKAKRIEATQEYYFSKKLREIALLNEQGKDIVNLGIGSPDLPPADQVILRLAEVAAKPDAHGYQSYKGIPGLRKAYAHWYLDTYNVKLDPETEILPLLGSKEGITYISQTYVEEGDEVLVPNPGYPAYGAAVRIAGGTVRHYELSEANGWMPDLAALEKTDLKKVKLMWVNYPHMPTGSIASREVFQEIVDFTNRHHILLCNDNPYSLIRNEKPLSILSVKGENVLELNSLSKSHNMAGWRMGMVAGGQEHINNILITKSNVDSGMFLPVQEAAIVALQLGKDWNEKLNSTYEQRSALAKEMAGTLGCTFQNNQAGLFLWAKAPESISDVARWIDRILYDAGVFITPGAIFGSRGERYIRISLCANEARLTEALERIKKNLTNNIFQP